MNAPVLVQLPDWSEPQDRFEEYVQQAHCVWLDNAASAEGVSIIAANPCRVVTAKRRRATIHTADGMHTEDGDPFAILQRELERFHAVTTASASTRIPPGAAIGYLGYDLKNGLERLPATAVDDLALPDLWFGFYRNLLVFDHQERVVWQVTTADDPVINTSPPASADHHDPEPTDQVAVGSGLTADFSPDGYMAAVARAKDYIAAGDIYQVSPDFLYRVENAPRQPGAVLRVSRHWASAGLVLVTRMFSLDHRSRGDHPPDQGHPSSWRHRDGGSRPCP